MIKLKRMSFSPHINLSGGSSHRCMGSDATTLHHNIQGSRSTWSKCSNICHCTFMFFAKGMLFKYKNMHAAWVLFSCHLISHALKCHHVTSYAEIKQKCVGSKLNIRDVDVNLLCVRTKPINSQLREWRMVRPSHGSCFCMINWSSTAFSWTAWM